MKRALLMGFLVAAALVGSVWAAYTRDASGDGNVMITAAIEYLISDGVTVNAGTNLNTSALATNASVDGLEAGLGTATTIAVDGDAAGSAVAQLRGINKKLAASVAITGSVTTSGTVTEASAATILARLVDLTTTPVAKTITPLVKEVAASGTGVPLVASETFARKVYLMAKKTAGANTGLVYIGSSTVDVAGPQQMTLAPGDEITIDPGPGCKIDLATIYIDCAAANTDGVTGWYIPL